MCGSSLGTEGKLVGCARNSNGSKDSLEAGVFGEAIHFREVAETPTTRELP